MSIVTKTGDMGVTSLLYGGRVRKDDLRIEINGILDELSSFLGLIKSLIKKKRGKDLINKIQVHLWMIGSEISTKVAYLSKLKKRLKQEDIKYLESLIKKLEGKYRPEERCFVLAGKNTISSTLDIARTIARTAERRVVTFNSKTEARNRCILVYLNRLSDLLYLLARHYEIGKK